MPLELKALHIGSRSAVVCLCDPSADYSAEKYVLTVNGRKTEEERAVVTLHGLGAGRHYSVFASRGDDIGPALEFDTPREPVTLNVRDFGAWGDGAHDDTPAVQAAIYCCPPGGRVLLPEGTFNVTCLFLKSGITFEIASGGVLKAIPQKERLPVLPGRIEGGDESSEYLYGSWEGNPLDCFASVITGVDIKNTVVCGEGVIDGSADFSNWWNAENRIGDPGRPHLIYLNRCFGITVTGITLKNSPSWNIHPFFCENLGFYDLKIESPANSHNTDGINPQSCTGVEIAGVRFSVGDDCIAIKSGKLYMGRTYKTPSRDIHIHNCLMYHGHGGVTVGSEIAAGADGVTVKNCRFVGTDRGLRVKTRRGRGEDSYIRGIVFENVVMQDVLTPFVINSFYYCGPDGKSDYVASKEPLPIDSRTPRVGGISVRNCVCTGCHAAGVYFYGLPEMPIERVELENVKISFSDDARPAVPAMMRGCKAICRLGVFIRNAREVLFKNVAITGFSGEPADVDGVDSFRQV